MRFRAARARAETTEEGATKADLERAMKGHVLGGVELIRTFAADER